MRLLPRDDVTCEVGVLGLWVRIVSGVVGEETVVGLVAGTATPSVGSAPSGPTVGPVIHAQPGAGRACGRLYPDPKGEAHMERAG